MLNIEPIKLLQGTHSDTAQTGSGCFMNVIAYLNGEPQITDQSPCVCVTVRPIAIYLNDLANDEQRQRLIPFIERAMGSTTEDRTELIRRAWLAVDFADFCKNIAAKYAAESAAEYAKYDEYAAKYAAKYAAESAKYAAESAAEYAEYAESAAESAKYAAESAAEYAEYAESAESAAEYAKYAEYAAKYAAKYAESAKYAKYAAESAAKYAAKKEQIFEAGLKFLDQALPSAQLPTLEVMERAARLCELVR